MCSIPCPGHNIAICAAFGCEIAHRLLTQISSLPLNFEQVQQHLLRVAEPDKQVLRVLLAALNHLRGRQLDGLLKGLKGLPSGSEDPALWRKVCLLLLRVAHSLCRLSLLCLHILPGLCFVRLARTASSQKS